MLQKGNWVRGAEQLAQAHKASEWQAWDLILIWSGFRGGVGVLVTKLWATGITTATATALTTTVTGCWSGTSHCTCMTSFHSQVKWPAGLWSPSPCSQALGLLEPETHPAHCQVQNCHSPKTISAFNDFSICKGWVCWQSWSTWHQPFPAV